jgi:hypothetical protein
MDLPLRFYANLVLLLDGLRPAFLPQLKKQEQQIVEYVQSFGDVFKITWLNSKSLLIHTQPLPFNFNDKRRKNRFRDLGILLGYPQICIDDFTKTYHNKGENKKEYIMYSYEIMMDNILLYSFRCLNDQINMEEEMEKYSKSLETNIRCEIFIVEYSILIDNFSNNEIPLTSINNPKDGSDIIVNGKRFRRYEISGDKILLFKN